MYTETGEETKALPAYAFSGLNNLEEVRLSGVKELGSFCFLNAGNRSSQGLEVFEISSVTKIANHAFNGGEVHGKNENFEFAECSDHRKQCFLTAVEQILHQLI